MSQERVRISVDHGVAEVTLARPDKMNALDPAMFDALIDALARLRDTPGLRAVVLHGEGRAFCAGPTSSSRSAGRWPTNGASPSRASAASSSSAPSRR